MESKFFHKLPDGKTVQTAQADRDILVRELNRFEQNIGKINQELSEKTYQLAAMINDFKLTRAAVNELERNMTHFEETHRKDINRAIIISLVVNVVLLTALFFIK